MTKNYGRILLAEMIGTAVLMLGGPGTAILAGDRVGVLGVSLGFGFSLLIMAYCIGPISGCHINPAVSLAMWLARKVEARHAVFAVVGQVIGAVAGAAMIWGLARGLDGFARGNFAANGFDRIPASNTVIPKLDGTAPFYSLGTAMAAEILFTAVLVMVVLFTTSRHFSVGMGGVVAGLTLALIHMISIPLDNTSVNPARSLGAALFAAPDMIGLKQLWVFIIFPLIGAVVGVVAWLMLDEATLEDTLLVNVPGADELSDVIDDAAAAANEALDGNG
jgi:aquaporin Z